MFVLLFIILPLSTVRNVDSLSVVSYVTVVFYCIFVMRMLFESIPRLFDGKWALDVYWWRQEGILTRCLKLLRFLLNRLCSSLQNNFC